MEQRETKNLPAGRQSKKQETTLLFPFTKQGAAPDLYGLAPVKALPADRKHDAGAQVKTIRVLEQGEAGQDISRSKMVWLAIAGIGLLIAIFFILVRLFTLLPGGNQTNEAERVLSALPGVARQA